MTITSATQKKYTIGDTLAAIKNIIDVQVGKRRAATAHAEQVKAANKRHYEHIHKRLVSSAKKEQAVLLQQYLYIYKGQGMRGVSNIALQTLEKHILQMRELQTEYEDYAHRALLSSMNSDMVVIPEGSTPDYAKFGNPMHREEFLVLDGIIDYHANALRAFITHDCMVSVYECEHNTGYYGKLKETILRYTLLQQHSREDAVRTSLLAESDTIRATALFTAGVSGELFERVVFY